MDEVEYSGTLAQNPAELARLAAEHEEFCRNQAWLEQHQEEVEGQALGQFLVVAGLQAFIAEKVQDAVAKARAAHPNETGMLIKYVPPRKPPRRER
jgi:hypothetical protein